MSLPHSSQPTSTDHVYSQRDLISSFVSDWVELKWFYSEVAEATRELCQNMLDENRIRGQVTCRVKNGSRLETKLRERVLKEGKVYRGYTDIRDDIVDLAGVRIALYFPSDCEKVDKIIRDCFSVIKHKIFPDDNWVSKDEGLSSEKPILKRRFGGYSANHYRVRPSSLSMKRDELRRDLQKSKSVIEIQVASVLMHAWAEIDHDLVYKTLTSGPASEEELRLLDAANGLVHTGEVLLQQLQIAMEERVLYQNRPFENYHKLQEFLQGQIKAINGPIEDLDILLHVLRLTGLDSPWQLGQDFKTRGLTIPEKAEPTDIAFIITSHVLGALPETEAADTGPSLIPKPLASTDAQSDASKGPHYRAGELYVAIYRQAEILERAIKIVDLIRFPKPSILTIKNMPAVFKTFNALYSSAQANLQRLGDDVGRIDAMRFREELVKQLNTLWLWFEKNNDIRIRVALQLARLDGENVLPKLLTLRPSAMRQLEMLSAKQPIRPQSLGERRRPPSLTMPMPSTPSKDAYGHFILPRPSVKVPVAGVANAPSDAKILNSQQMANTSRPISMLKPAAERVPETAMKEPVSEHKDMAGHAQAGVAHGAYPVISAVSTSTEKEVTENWAIDSSEKETSDQIFEKLDKAQMGKLAPLEVVKYFKRSALPNKVLSHIWDLADTQQKGYLTKDEFAVALHLIKHQVDKRGPLPNELPKALISPRSI